LIADLIAESPILAFVVAFIAAMGIPSAITGIAIWWLKKQMDKRDAKFEEKEKNTERMILLIAQNSRATYTVAEATAKAVQRIPEAHCNGDMTDALARAKAFQMEEQQFLIDQGIKRIFGE
jgi:hypothetical protein